ncbi:carboxymuconolactone decarboxylase family protein [mine drainage metagenome]|uniref:Carboxymuconolactone decarboxylase family protein n=1 Tax=mine drainage metagenome TaxID=410659 RepID=A0A1J5RN65_9ZZZZ
MVKDWIGVAGDLGPAIVKLRGGIPDVMKAFSQMDQAVSQNGALDPKTKELIALALGVASRCDGCLAFHAKACVKYGASREEVMEMLGMAIYMGGGPSMIYAAQALEAFEQWQEKAAK